MKQVLVLGLTGFIILSCGPETQNLAGESQEVIISPNQNSKKPTESSTSPASLPQVSGQGSLKGRVTTSSIRIQQANSNEIGVSNARVYIEETLQETQTDQNGFFEINNVPTGQHTLVAEKNTETGESFKLRQSVVIKTNETVDVKSLLLRKTGVVFGNVILEGQTDHTGIDIFVSGSNIVAKTDNNGDFAIIDIPEGEYKISVVKTGFDLQQLDKIKVESGKATQLPGVTLKKEVQAETTTLQGQIKEKGVGIPFATVKLKGLFSQHLTLTNEEGFYEMGALRPGKYEINAFVNGYKAKNQSFEISLSQKNQLDFELDKQLENTLSGTINGSLKDNEGNPLANISISTKPNSQTVTTDSQGNFTLDQIRPGAYLISATENGQQIATALTSVSKNQKLSIQLKKNVTGNDSPIPLPTLAPSEVSNTNSQETVSAIVVSDGTTTLKVGDKVTYRAQATLSNDNSSADIIWTSSDSGIASVSSSGEVTAKQVGSVVITASVKDFPGKSVAIFLKVVS